MKNILLLATALFCSAMTLTAQDSTNDYWTNDSNGNITTDVTGFGGQATIQRSSGSSVLNIYGKSNNQWQSSLIRIGATDHNDKWLIMQRGTKSPTQYKDLTFYSYDPDLSHPYKMTLSLEHASGAVGVGTNTVPSGYKLGVAGKAIFEEVKVSLLANWPDYVFEPEYSLTPLNELKTQIEDLGHLPNVPSAEEVAENGFHLGEMDATLLEKIEELTLYLIEFNETVETLKNENVELRQENESIRQEISNLKK